MFVLWFSVCVCVRVQERLKSEEKGLGLHCWFIQRKALRTYLLKRTFIIIIIVIMTVGEA